MNPLKTSMKSVTQAVKTMPDNMLSTVDGVMDNLSKIFGNPKKTSIFYENTKVSAGLDTEVLLYFMFSRCCISLEYRVSQFIFVTDRWQYPVANYAPINGRDLWFESSKSMAETSNHNATAPNYSHDVRRHSE